MTFFANSSMFWPDTEQAGFTIEDFGGGIAYSGAVNAAAYNAAVSALGTNGGALWFGAGTYTFNPVTIAPKVHCRGMGIEATIIQLAAGANADLFSVQASAINLSAVINTGPAPTAYNYGFYDMTLDGNSSNQSSGTSYCMRAYSAGFIVQNVRMRYGYSGGWLQDYNYNYVSTFPPDQMETQVSNLKIHDCGGDGLEWGGPISAQFDNIVIFNNAFDNLHNGPNAASMRISNIHCYGPGGGTINAGYVNMLLEAPSTVIANASSDGSLTCGVVILNNKITYEGRSFGEAGGLGLSSGIQIGFRNGDTAFHNQVQSGNILPIECMIIADISTHTGTNGSLYVRFDGGNNTYICNIYNLSGKYYTGSIASSSHAYLTVGGLTSDGTTNLGGLFQISEDSNQSIVVYNSTSGNTKLQLDAHNNLLYLEDGTELRIHEDQFTTVANRINYDNKGSIIMAGALSVGQSSTTPDPGNSGTVATAAKGVSRITPTANETGLILAVGTQPGQMVTVSNNSSSFYCTWATSATSHILGELGGTFPLYPNSSQSFVWDSVLSLWVLQGSPLTGPLMLMNSAAVSAASGAAITAGRAYFILADPVQVVQTFTKMRIYVSSDAGGNIDMGIYKADGTNGNPSTRVASTGAIASAANVYTQNLSSSAVLFPGQNYYMAVLCTNASSLFMRQLAQTGLGPVVATTSTALASLPSPAGSITGASINMIQVLALTGSSPF